jgi:hypothetical protein
LALGIGGFGAVERSQEYKKLRGVNTHDKVYFMSFEHHFWIFGGIEARKNSNW